MPSADRVRASNGRNVAYMEEADESGEAIRDTKTYAASTASSPTKEKPNTGRTRSSRTRESTPPSAGLTDSDSTLHPSGAKKDSGSKTKDKDRTKEKEKSSSGKKAVTVTRVPIKSSKSAPAVQPSAQRQPYEQSTYYGVTPITTASSRPRVQRPVSYISTSRPPLSNQKYWGQPIPAVLPTSYPPTWTPAPPVAYAVAPSPVSPITPAGDYFSAAHQQHLQARFNRPHSAYGHRVEQPVTYQDNYPSTYEQPLSRRGSLNSRKAAAKELVDRARMPPPTRPVSARPQLSSAFAPPPRRPQVLSDEDFEADGPIYQDVPAAAPYGYDYAPVRATRRPTVSTNSMAYDVGPYRTEVAGNRRHSYYDGQPLPSANTSAEKMHRATTFATSYQDEVNGGPTMPLTTEALRKVGKTGGSSRSTRSSGSHDESDYRKSATTRTTRSSANNDEDITIRVKGGATLKVGNTEMQCVDGAEINIASRSTGGGTVRGGSDKASSVYVDDRRTRIDRPVARGRSNSQAGSYTRTTPMWDYGYGYAANPRASDTWI